MLERRPSLTQLPKIVDSRQGGPIRVYGTFGGENFNRRCRFDVEAPPAVYKLPERFVSVSTKAYAANASYVACQAPPLTTYDVEDASVVRAKVFVLENGVDPSKLRHPLVRPRTSSSDGLSGRWSAIRRLFSYD